MWSRYQDGVKYGFGRNLDGGFFFFVGLTGFFAALICCFLIGPEYGDGTMRTKIVSGHTRRNVYMTNLLLSCLASLMFCAAAIFPGLALGLPLLDGFEMGTSRAVMMILGSCTLSLANAALFTFLAMMVSHRAVAVSVATMLAVALLAAGSYTFNRLQAPATLNEYGISIDGQVSELQSGPNPEYLPEGPLRTVFQFLSDALPGGQAGQYITTKAEHPVKLMTYDGAIVFLTTAAGLVLFNRKDLK